MTTQSEAVLEDLLIAQLEKLGYENAQYVHDEKSLLANFKKQLEIHNKTTLSQRDFEKILNHLQGGTVFEKAHKLRDKFSFENEAGETEYIEFIDTTNWCKNQFQVTNQITVKGKRENRYDVTLLINGLPLVQIELKKTGLELKEAFNQINRYHRDSYASNIGLFQYVQLFVISNGVNTKYFANNRKQSFKQTFFWADEKNKLITRLSDFTDEFLEPCHVSKMICKYIVLQETDKILMVLRPYQFYAVERIVKQVENNPRKGGYIWHTTGSGKTLTSFKASQIIQSLKEVHKVVFVVDRKDLDFQTVKEFNHFAEGSIDGTDNTKILVQQFRNEYKDSTGKPKDNKLIITTIQKLNNAIQNKRYLAQMQDLKDKRMVFIFDECHRSQFGETHKRIKDFFQNVQMFGFTGTPIFEDNAVKNKLGKRSTKMLFGDRLHDYLISNAIKDQNVLRFAVEYVGKYQYKNENPNNIDIEVEDIDKRELIEAPQRLGKIADYIIQQHPRTTQNQKFNAIFCVGSTDMLIRYYDIFKRKKEAGEHHLKIATIFSYGANEASLDLEKGFDLQEFNEVAEEQETYGKDKRDKLEAYIEDYNQLFGTKYSTKDSQTYYNYYNDIAKRMRFQGKLIPQDRIDILLVVNMFLTGFDSKNLNTLYADKNLRFHGLIQAFSRTNRTLDESKRQGNIICFRNLKEATDTAITLFSDKDAKEDVILEPYQFYVDKFKESLEKLKEITPEVDAVDALPSEEEELKFVQAFRELKRLQTTMSGFAEFDFEDIGIEEQELAEYQSKYLDIHQKVRNERQKQKVSVLHEVDFELELIHRDDITVKYILNLLAKLRHGKKEEREQERKKIKDLLDSQVQLKSKKELILKFIDENLPKIEDEEQIEFEFEEFLKLEGANAFNQLCEEEGLENKGFEKVLKDYIYDNIEPTPQIIFDTMLKTPSLLQRTPVFGRILEKIKDFVGTYVDRE